MSDYLGRLAARSLGLAEVIRPRPAGLFETAPHPAEAASIPATEVPGEFRSPPAEAPRATRGPSAVPEATKPPRREAPAAARTTGVPAIHAAMPHPVPVPSTVVGDVASTEPRSLVATPRMSAPPAAPEPAPARPAWASPIERPPTGDRRSASVSVAAPPATAGPATAPAAPARGRPASPSVPRAVHTAALPQPRITPAQLADILPARQPSIAAPAGIAAFHAATPGRDRAAPERAASSTTIQVTIGRVEVRASVAAAAAPRRRAAAAPTMSLEDYLKERAGRGRA